MIRLVIIAAMLLLGGCSPKFMRGDCAANMFNRANIEFYRVVAISDDYFLVRTPIIYSGVVTLSTVSRLFEDEMGKAIESECIRRGL